MHDLYARNVYNHEQALLNVISNDLFSSNTLEAASTFSSSCPRRRRSPKSGKHLMPPCSPKNTLAYTPSERQTWS